VKAGSGDGRRLLDNSVAPLGTPPRRGVLGHPRVLKLVWKHAYRDPKKICKAAITQARARLRAEIIKSIVDEALSLIAPRGVAGVSHRGHRLMALDGIILDLPDFAEVLGFYLASQPLYRGGRFSSGEGTFFGLNWQPLADRWAIEVAFPIAQIPLSEHCYH
jgi:hypothetical protein